MSMADREALALRDLAVAVAKAKGVLISEANARSFTAITTRACASNISMAGRKCSTCTATASWN